MAGQRLLGALTWPARMAGHASLAALDTALASSVVEQAVDRTLASTLARHAVDRAFQGPIVDAIASDLVRYRVVERVVDELLDEGLVERTVDRILSDLLDSDELWVLVERVAASPAVTLAVTQQTAGFADEVAGGVRARSHNADAWLERHARRALRRPAR
jgi:hypothetical protein